MRYLIGKLKSKNYVFFLLINFFALSPQASIALQATQPLVPRYVSGVESILNSHQYIREHDAPLYWKLSPYYISQPTDCACSLASVVMIINAIRSSQPLAANQQLATTDNILKRVEDKSWQDNVKKGGNGVTLDEVKPLMSKALKAYGLKNFTVEVIHTKNTSKETAEKLHHDLMGAEQTGHVFIIANFNQKFISGTMSVGHFSPIGAYDAQTKRVLIMDTDRELFEPYWVPEKLFLQSMSTIDEDAHNCRGYLLIKIDH
ncbi:phytochelatin synthase family protein [Legionella maioricensis]|uniref:glutathione gamma-glutamylcysteinyltransferase n=1 Tax=Legionella maioricensis TaxID=2896528 RepID=A0A9X2CZ54_9GAMM|nr:phytochelatin synthase family protein [Legionella maioricensis]MCL9683372.1 phytochelatin synthase family protein [Legionella maioricensis]MCL9685932.1 phytochelatin synthase family protein [Legionella maioricensis]